MELIGIYTVENNPEVHLIELTFDKSPDKVIKDENEPTPKVSLTLQRIPNSMF